MRLWLGQADSRRAPLSEPSTATVTARRSASTIAAGGGVLLFGATALSNVGAFLFHVVVSRQLEPSSYGALGALLGIMLVLAVPAGALQVSITRSVASRRDGGRGEPRPLEIGPLLANGVIVSGLAGLALAAASPVVRSFLRLDGVAPALLLAAWVVTAGIGLVPKAVLLGELRFRRVAVAIVAGAVARLGFAALLSRGANPLEGAMAATVLSELVIAATVLPGVAALVRGYDNVQPTRIGWREIITPVVALAGFWVLTAIDTILARRLLPHSEAGYYAAAATAARIALFLPGAIATIAFPRFAEGGGRGPASRAALFQALSATVAGGVLAAVLLALAPRLAISLLFGDEYLPAAGLVGVLGISSACLGVIILLIHYHLAAHLRMAAACGPVALLALAAVLAIGPSPLRIAVVMLTATASTAVALTASATALPRTRARPQGDLYAHEPELDLTVVVPYFNPGPEVTVNLERIIAVLTATGASFEIIAVSDGSTDGSQELLAAVAAAELRNIVLPTNQGKGVALRVGLAMGRGRYVGFIDADGDVDPSVLAEFVTVVRTYEPDIVLASKRHPMSNVQYPVIRRVYSWSYQQLARLMFRLNVRDTQTGAKLIRRDTLVAVLPRMREKRFAVDLELLVVARRLGYRRLFEVPVQIRYQFRSTVSVGAVGATLIDTLAVFYRLRLLRWYDEPHSDLVGFVDLHHVV